MERQMFRLGTQMFRFARRSTSHFFQFWIGWPYLYFAHDGVIWILQNGLCRWGIYPKDLFIEWIVRSNRIDITVLTFPPHTNAFQYGYCDNSGIGLHTRNNRRWFSVFNQLGHSIFRSTRSSFISWYLIIGWCTSWWWDPRSTLLRWEIISGYWYLNWRASKLFVQ